MALFSCPECGQQVSDQADACPHCGNPIKSVHEVADLSQETISAKGNRKRLITVAGSLIVIVVCIIVGIFINGISSKDAYKENLVAATNQMFSGALSAETAGNQVKSVWYNTIYEKFDADTDKYTRKDGGTGKHYDDFNDSLGVLFSDEDFKKTIDSIRSNQNDVKELMKALTNPPDEYAESYSALRDLYDAYLEITNLVCSPSGSLTTFSESFSSIDSKTLNCYNKMKLYTE